jgi:hypothetical protein
MLEERPLQRSGLVQEELSGICERLLRERLHLPPHLAMKSYYCFERQVGQFPAVGIRRSGRSENRSADGIARHDTIGALVDVVSTPIMFTRQAHFSREQNPEGYGFERRWVKNQGANYGRKWHYICDSREFRDRLRNDIPDL